MDPDIKGPVLSCRWGEIAVRESSDRADADWVLCDEATDEEIPIWPSDVPEVVAMLEAFADKQSQAVEATSQAQCEVNQK